MSHQHFYDAFFNNFIFLTLMEKVSKHNDDIFTVSKKFNKAFFILFFSPCKKKTLLNVARRLFQLSNAVVFFNLLRFTAHIRTKKNLEAP